MRWGVPSPPQETCLTPLHRAAAVPLVAFQGFLVPERFGDPAEEDRFLRETVGVMERSPRGLLVVQGKTVTDFLQRLVTSDVRALKEGEGQPSCILTSKGKLVAAFHLYRATDDVYALVFAEPLREEPVRVLEKYGALEDIAMEDDTPRTTSLSVQGPLAQKLLGSFCEHGSLPLEPSREEIIFGGGHRLFVRRADETLAGGWESRKAYPELWEALLREARALGGGPVGQAAAEVHRIEAGIPRWGVDFDGNNFPNEAGWESAVSYTKGCYIGQEVIARMRTYGHLNRKLMAITFPDARETPAGTKLYRDGKEVGSTTSSAVSFQSGRTVALAYIRSSAWDPGTRLAAAPDGPAEVEVAERPAALRRE